MNSTIKNGKNNVNILITGVSGFIGFSLAEDLLKKKITEFMELIIMIIIILFYIKKKELNY